MDEHHMVDVDQFPKPKAGDPGQLIPRAVGYEPRREASGAVPGYSSPTAVDDDKVVVVVVDHEDADEDTPLIGMAECRICQEEDSLSSLESPCACSGSLKYAHRKCVQHWCNEKGNITCEICHQTYESGYTAPLRPPSDECVIDIGDVWLSSTLLDMHDSRLLLALSGAERRLFETDNEDYNDANNNGAAFCRSIARIARIVSNGAAFCSSIALIIMTLMVLQQVVFITDDGEADADAAGDATMFSLYLLRALGILLPCYIMICAITIIPRRLQRQEAASLTAAQFAIVVQAAQNRGLLIPAAPAATPQPTALQEHPQRNDS